MQRNNRVVTSRTPVKTAAKTGPQVRRTVQGKIAVKASTAPKKTVIGEESKVSVEGRRRHGGRHNDSDQSCDQTPSRHRSPTPTCESDSRPRRTPSCDSRGSRPHRSRSRDRKDRSRSRDRHGKRRECNPQAITFRCEPCPTHLPCLRVQPIGEPIEDETSLIIRRNSSGTIIESTVVDDSDLDRALDFTDELARCVRTTCQETCDDVEAPAVSPICSIVAEDDSLVSVNGGYYSVTRRFRVTDACGNTATFDRTVTFTVDDGTGPVITISPPVSSIPGAQTCPTGTNPEEECEECIDLGCNPTPAQIRRALGTATVDRCGKLSEAETSQVETDGCFKWQRRTWRAKDECGNRSTRCRVVRWIDDTIRPTITLVRPPGFEAVFPDFSPDPNVYDLGCNPLERAVGPAFLALGIPATIEAIVNAAAGTPSTGELCGQTISQDDVLTEGCCERTLTRTFRAEDACGNRAIRIVFTVRWKEDDEPPIIQCPPDFRVDCNVDPRNPDIFGEPAIFDVCDGIIPLDSDQVTVVTTRTPPTGTNPDGTVIYRRTWTATDSCGNVSAPRTQTIIAESCDSPPEPRVRCGTVTTWPCDNLPDVPQDDDFDDLTAADVSGFGVPFNQLVIEYSAVTNVAGPAPGTRLYRRTVTVTHPTDDDRFATCTQVILVPNCNGSTSGNTVQQPALRQKAAPSKKPVALKKAAPSKKAPPAAKLVAKKVAPKPAVKKVPAAKKVAQPGPLGQRAAPAPTRRSFLPK